MSSDINQAEELNQQEVNGETAEDLSFEQLQRQLAEEQKKAVEYLDSFQRARADFQNLKRRTDNERLTLSSEVREKLLVKLLPIVDDFERALQNVPEALQNEPWINGVSLIEKKLKTLLDQEGVSVIDATNAEFDPRLHEAVQHDDLGGTTDYVAATYAKGYRMGDKVIRPAMVKVERK